MQNHKANDTRPPYRLSNHKLLIGRVQYAVLMLLCVGMFVSSSYGQAAQWAFSDCEDLYFLPEYADGCTLWREAITNTGLTPGGFALYFVVLRTAAALPFIVLSLLLIRRRGEELRVLLLAGFLVLLGFAGPIYNPFWQWSQAWFSVENQVPVLRTLTLLLDFSLSLGIALFIFLFPDGQFLPKWARWIAGIWLLMRAGDVFFADTPASLYVSAPTAAVIINIIFTVVGIGALFWRYRVYSTDVQRQQIKWIVAGGLVLAANYVIDYGVWEIYPAVTNEWLIATREQGVIWELFQDTAWYVSQVIFAVCVGLAVFRHRLWDIDVILNRALVYATLTGLIVALYVMIVGGLGAVFHTQTTAINGLVATGIIAVLFQPLRDRLQRVVNRLLYGERDDPAEVLTRLAYQMQTGDTHTGILTNLAETIAQTLKIPHVVIRLSSVNESPKPASTWDEHNNPERTATQVIPLVYQSEAVGQLVVAQRSPHEVFNSQEQRLLATIAALTASTVRAVQMSNELHQSRQHIINAREEERRRIRRDLHDGLGPALASLPLKVDAAMDLMEQDREVSVKLLGDVKRQAQQLVGDVRRVVHDLRPPALDELGLAEALRSALSQLKDPLHRLQLHLDVDDLPTELPAAVEAASYRITMEAVTNVMKHARAQNCWIALQLAEANEQIHISVEDDGIGIAQGVVANVGLRSMRERAEELGGSFQIQPRPTGGTCIRVTLPIPNKGQSL